MWYPSLLFVVYTWIWLNENPISENSPGSYSKWHMQLLPLPALHPRLFTSSSVANLPTPNLISDNCYECTLFTVSKSDPILSTPGLAPALEFLFHPSDSTPIKPACLCLLCLCWQDFFFQIQLPIKIVKCQRTSEPSCSALFCPVPSCSALDCTVSFCFVPFRSVLCRSVLSCAFLLKREAMRSLLPSRLFNYTLYCFSLSLQFSFKYHAAYTVVWIFQFQFAGQFQFLILGFRYCPDT